MATTAYRNWVADGKPFTLAIPVKEYRAAFLAAGWPASYVGTIGNDDHLTADNPQDHCPFSFTGWPLTHPYPYVTAVDAAHRPSEGLDIKPIVDYWLYEARGGRTPWVKYIIFEGRRYDVRNNWVPVNASGHFDHSHTSMRTDWVSKSTNGWRVVERGSIMEAAERLNHIIETGLRPEGNQTSGGIYINWLVRQFAELKASQASVHAKLDAIAQRAPETVLDLTAEELQQIGEAARLAVLEGFEAQEREILDGLAERLVS